MWLLAGLSSSQVVVLRASIPLWLLTKDHIHFLATLGLSRVEAAYFMKACKMGRQWRDSAYMQVSVFEILS